MHDETLSGKPIRDLRLAIDGTPLAPILARFQGEFIEAGLTRVKPRFYLSTEWGVPFETVALAIPFFLARPDLADFHLQRTGHIEGTDAEDILRYLRHELGHVVNYAYRLYDEPEWVQLFGAITQPYRDQYSPEPFSRRFVWHLPGWYAQKHPDEDWAETFAVWLTPGREWRRDYGAWPIALGKLAYCERVIARVGDLEPPVTDDALDEPVTDIDYSIRELYDRIEPEPLELPPGIDGALAAVAGDLAPVPGEATTRVAARLRALELTLVGQIYRWTGHLPEHTKSLVAHAVGLAEARELAFAARHDQAFVVGVTALLTSLALNHVRAGSYLPE